MHHSDHLAGRSVGQLTPVGISALILRTKEYGTPAVMLVADKGCITSVHPSAIDSAQGMTGVVAVGNVAWLLVAGNPPGMDGGEPPDWIISTRPGAAWCGFQAWAVAMSRGVGVLLQAFSIFEKHLAISQRLISFCFRNTQREQATTQSKSAWMQTVSSPECSSSTLIRLPSQAVAMGA